jgi:hypothetical protein
MTASDQYQWRRDTDGLGVWEYRGEVAVAGVGHSPVDRHRDEVSMDKTVGAYSILACQKAMDEASVTPDQIDGVICCDSHIAGGSGGSASQWAPRPYFAPPDDSEWGLTLVNAKWLIEQMRRKQTCAGDTNRVAESTRTGHLVGAEIKTYAHPERVVFCRSAFANRGAVVQR